MQQVLSPIDYESYKLAPFQKKFYKQGKPKRSIEEYERFKKINKITIKSNDQVPNPMMYWEDTHFPDYLMKSIEDSKFSAPTPIQA